VPVVDFQSDPEVIWHHFRELTGFLAFDIGANAGMTSRLLSTGFHTVHAYEPASESYGALCGDCPDNVQPWLLAVSDTSEGVNLDTRSKALGLGELTTGDSPLAYGWGTKDGEGRHCPSTTVDAETAKHGPPDFIKVDTEGHEVHVIRGATQTLEEHNPRLLIEVHTQENGDAIREMIPGRLERVPHPAYPPGSSIERGHYWLVRL
jgi:FkbM family methyltransferase